MCYTWNARGKWPVTQTTFGAAWATSGAARAHAGVLPHMSNALCIRLLPLRGSVRTLALRTDVRALPSPYTLLSMVALAMVFRALYNLFIRTSYFDHFHDISRAAIQILQIN
jgi:hypothetical protein